MQKHYELFRAASMKKHYELFRLASRSITSVSLEDEKIVI